VPDAELDTRIDSWLRSDVAALVVLEPQGVTGHPEPSGRGGVMVVVVESYPAALTRSSARRSGETGSRADMSAENRAEQARER